MKTFKYMYAVFGLTLLVICIYHGTKGLSEKDKHLYRYAYELSDELEEKIWPDYNFKEYPVAVRKGNYEYVLKGESQGKRRAALPVIAATAYWVKDEMNIFIPSKSVMDSLGQLVEGLSGEEEMLFIKGFSLEKKTISDNQYIAILHHEGLHAFQFDNYSESLFKIMTKEEEERIRLLSTIDQDASLQNLYNKEKKKLVHIIGLENKGDIIEGIKEYIALRNIRREELIKRFGNSKSEELLMLENYYEKVEGTARYIEVKAVELMKDENLYKEYMDSLQETVAGKEKYYRSGMAMCLVLDKLGYNWKEDVFKRTDSIFEILIATIGGI